MRRVPLAARQLRRNRALALGGILGIAAALVMIVVLDAFLEGMEHRLTAFVRASGADVVVAQAGVRTMHMTESAISLGAAEQVGEVEGVRDAIPALYVSTAVQHESHGGLVYLFGYDAAGPPLLRLLRGTPPDRGEIVLDRVLAERIGIEPGEDVSVLDRPMRVSGLVDGTYSIASSTALVHRADLAAALRLPDAVSYVFVRTDGRAGAREVARRIDAEVPGVSAWTTEAFTAAERKVVSDMATGIVRAITLTALLIGVTITALISHTLVTRQARDVAVLRAIGLRDGPAVTLALRQSGLVLLAATALAAIVVAVLVTVLPALSDALTLRVDPVRALRSVAFVTVAVLAGSLLPARRARSLPPAEAFRR